MDVGNIRNFVIIAHIDHGKSTLADRMLELTGTVERRKMRAQFLDMNPLERERGITIKLSPVRMEYGEYVLNLIDTPGHADFSYEVSRALAAVEGAILLVDATQGVQAQTLANLSLAEQEGLAIIPVINKIDLPSADVSKAEEELGALLGTAPDDILKISAKEGTGVADILAAVIRRVPPPRQTAAVLRALIFDSKYDPYLGVVAHVRIMDGVLRTGDRILCMASGATAEALEVGVFAPERSPAAGLSAGEIGYVATGLKEPNRVRVGDTITHAYADRHGYYPTRIDADTVRDNQRIDPRRSATIEPLAGYREVAPVVFASLFPEDQNDFERLRDALGKLHLEDAALVYEPEDAGDLGRGFRAGFLGLLHMEIVAERLRREYDLVLALSRPSVAFRVSMQRGGDPLTVYAASRMPDAHEIAGLEEPWARIEMVLPVRFLGAIASLVTGSEGVMTKTETLTGDRMRVEAEIPLRTVVTDFYDRLKSISEGFASFAYTLIGYRSADLVRLDIMVAGDVSPVLAEVVPSVKAYDIGRQRIAALKELLPRELFAVALQAAVGGKIIARETLPALKKDVTGYMYGGDRTRKMKLWKKQQRGKKRLKETGRVTIPPDVFFKLHKSTFQT